MNDRNAFLKGIDADPLNHNLRCIYADWLDEHDQPEEADRQRRYLPALRVLERYADTDWKYRQPGYREEYERQYGKEEADEVWGGLKPFTYRNLMDNVAWWVEGVQAKSPYGGGNPWIGFGSNFAQDELHDPEKRREFWEAFEVVTGIQPPEDLRRQEWYHCAC